MAFMIFSIDVPNSEPLREPHRRAHLAYLHAQMDRLVASGCLLDEAGDKYIGACVLLDVETEEEARAFVAGDPFTKAGVTKDVMIARWREFYLDGKRTRG